VRCTLKTLPRLAGKLLLGSDQDHNDSDNPRSTPNGMLEGDFDRNLWIGQQHTFCDVQPFLPAALGDIGREQNAVGGEAPGSARRRVFCSEGPEGHAGTA
jgi:hypothetical protein